MRQQTVHAILRDRKLRVIEIIGMDRYAINKSCESRNGLQR